MPRPKVAASGKTLRLRLDDERLHAHPLLRADLEGEPDDIRGLGIELQLG